MYVEIVNILAVCGDHSLVETSGVLRFVIVKSSNITITFGITRDERVISSRDLWWALKRWVYDIREPHSNMYMKKLVHKNLYNYISEHINKKGGD